MTSAADVAALLHMLGGLAYTGGLFGFPLLRLSYSISLLAPRQLSVALWPLIVPALALLDF